MQFDWSPKTLKEWRDFYSRAKTANWMQNWAYAQASFKNDYLMSKLGLIIHDGKAVGMMCVQMIRLGPIEVINLKRGPLWFVEPTSQLLIEFAKAFREEFPKKALQRLRWMPELSPEITENDEIAKTITKLGFKLKKEFFLTSWIDLTLPVDVLRKNLDQKWRNCLNKAEKQNLKLVTQTSLKDFEVFLNYYELYKRKKRFLGPSSKFLRTEFNELNMTDDFVLLWAQQEHQPIAGVAIVFQGTTAAYRVGWNTHEGRKSNAHYLLLWQALQVAKLRGATKFDVGGLLPDEAPGVTHFKSGLKGQVTLCLTFA
ncbi:MAG: lipid II:glycine glycyltransferase FemX [Bdellovibrionia bacterium]